MLNYIAYTSTLGYASDVLNHAEPDDDSYLTNSWLIIGNAFSYGFFQVAHFLFCAFYLVNVQEASRVLRRQKPRPKCFTSSAIGCWSIIQFCTTIYSFWTIKEFAYLIIFYSSFFFSFFIMVVSLVWLKCILKDVMKMNLKLMAVHIIVLLDYLAFDLLTIYQLWTIETELDKDEQIKLKARYRTISNVATTNCFLCCWVVAEMVRRLAKRNNPNF
jgi:hypothetical protein